MTQPEAMLAIAKSDVTVLENLMPTMPNHIKTVPDAVATMLVARELGLQPMSSFADLMVIGGKVGMTSKMMLALVHRAGHRIDVSISTTVATAKCYRRYDGVWVQVGEFEFTEKDAETANLWSKDTYQLYPADMLGHKVVARAVRFTFPDVLLGYIPDEMEDITGIEAEYEALDVDATYGTEDEDPMDLHEVAEALDAKVEG